MSFLSRKTLNATVAELEDAAGQRFFEALHLAVSDDDLKTLGAIYLFGYVAEILLKTAYYRICGVNYQNEDVTPWLLGGRGGNLGMKKRAVQLNIYWTSNLHDVLKISELVVAERQHRSIPLDASLAGELKRHCLILSDHWNEELRYKAHLPIRQEVHQTYHSVDWIRTKHDFLWK